LKVSDQILQEPARSANDITSQFADGGKCVAERITAFLLSLKFNPKSKGFQYIRRAVSLVLRRGNGVYVLKRDIYPELSEIFATGAANLERGMANAIEAAFLSIDLSDFERVFGNTVHAEKGKPTVKEFISMARQHILLVES
jgi:two-component system response regulator (stage 0 sporulation protein A)